MESHMRVLALLIALPAIASAAPHLTQSGRVLDPAGGPINQTSTVTVTLLNEQDQATWTEDHTVTFEDGYYAIVLGTQTPLDPAMLLQDLDVSLAIDGTILSRQPLSATPLSLAVDGAVRISTQVPCGESTSGALHWTGESLQVCDGSTYVSVGKSHTSGDGFLLNVEGNADDALGNYAFSETAAVIYNNNLATEGSFSLSTRVYGSNGTGLVDYSLSSDEADTQWSLHPDVGDWAFQWDYRHTGDIGYGGVLFSNSTVWTDRYAQFCSPGNTTTPEVGWMICTYWGATEIFYKTTHGSVSWAYDGYSTTWHTLRMEKRGTTVEFFVDGVSRGAKTAPLITDTAPSRLYINGSTNGNQGSYTLSPLYSARYQMDRIEFIPL